MSQTSRYREQLDACRPGSADLALPALAELAGAVESDRTIADELARAQRFDRAVSVAMHDVPVPAGLLERLEAKLGAAELTEDSDALESTGEVALPPSPARFSRRSILATALSVAALALIAVVTMFWPKPGRPVSNAELTELSFAWFNQQLPPAAWKPVRFAPTAYAVPREVSGATVWQPFATPAGEKGVVYDLTGVLRPRASLFVIASPHKYQVGTLPTRLRSTTGNIAIGAWQRGGLLYVVVVVENGQKLEDFVRLPSIALHRRTTRITATP